MSEVRDVQLVALLRVLKHAKALLRSLNAMTRLPLAVRREADLLEAAIRRVETESE